MARLRRGGARAHQPGVRLALGHILRARDGGVTIEVRDHGPGIAPEVLPRLFEPFFTTKPSGVGTGLGLPICQQIVNSLGGTIEYTTELAVLDEDTWSPHRLNIKEVSNQDQWGTAQEMSELIARESFNDIDKGLFVAPPV